MDEVIFLIDLDISFILSSKSSMLPVLDKMIAEISSVLAEVSVEIVFKFSPTSLVVSDISLTLILFDHIFTKLLKYLVNSAISSLPLIVILILKFPLPTSLKAL